MEKIKDMIYRQDAIEAVISLCDDCDSDYCGYCRVNIDGGKDARKVLKDLPSAQSEPCEDFVKVFRCKKCRYVHCDKEFDNYWCNRMSGAFMVEAEGFCKWGR